MARVVVFVALFGVLTAGPVVAQGVSVAADVVYGHKYGMALTLAEVYDSGKGVCL